MFKACIVSCAVRLFSDNPYFFTDIRDLIQTMTRVDKIASSFLAPYLMRPTTLRTLHLLGEMSRDILSNM